ncbi:MAG: PaaI family thioesterase [Pseudomonadales bacterium]
MKLLSELRAEGRGQDMAAVVAAIPYARFLGIEIDRKGNEITTIMPFKDALVGNVMLPALHGGVIGAFLEITAVIQLLFDTSCERLPKTIDLSVDYLRSGRPLPTYGRAIVTRHGRRVANVRSEIWQEERGRPIGVSHGHFLLAPLTAD